MRGGKRLDPRGPFQMAGLAIDRDYPGARAGETAGRSPLGISLAPAWSPRITADRYGVRASRTAGAALPPAWLGSANGEAGAGFA